MEEQRLSSLTNLTPIPTATEKMKSVKPAAVAWQGLSGFTKTVFLSAPGSSVPRSSTAGNSMVSRLVFLPSGSGNWVLSPVEGNGLDASGDELGHIVTYLPLVTLGFS